MKLPSKFQIGDPISLQDDVGVIVGVVFHAGREPVYTVQWERPRYFDGRDKVFNERNLEAFVESPIAVPAKFQIGDRVQTVSGGPNGVVLEVVFARIGQRFVVMFDDSLSDPQRMKPDEIEIEVALEPA